MKFGIRPECCFKALLEEKGISTFINQLPTGSQLPALTPNTLHVGNPIHCRGF